jgi:hypothetical protein
MPAIIINPKNAIATCWGLRCSAENVLKFFIITDVALKQVLFFL